MSNIIKKEMTVGEVEKILKSFDIPLPLYWEWVLFDLLQGCDHIEIKGYGPLAKLVQVWE